jgi:hypothetical protein
MQVLLLNNRSFFSPFYEKRKRLAHPRQAQAEPRRKTFLAFGEDWLVT